MLIRRDDLLYSLGPFQNSFQFSVGRSFVFGQPCIFNNQRPTHQKTGGKWLVFFLTRQFAVENASVTKNKTATYGKCKGTLE